VIGLDHPFFALPWRRHLTVAVCFAWGLIEAITGASFWAAVFLGMSGYAFWQFGRIDWSKYDQDN